VLVIFIVELGLRGYAYRTKFLRDPWSLFDVTVVSLSLVPPRGTVGVAGAADPAGATAGSRRTRG
jgi:voltage-gated sodium channel